MVELRTLLVGSDLQNFFGTGVVLGFTVLRAVFLVLVGGSEGGGAAHKFVRNLGLVFALVLGDGLRRSGEGQNLRIRGGGVLTSSCRSLESPKWSNNPMMIMEQE